MKILEFTTSINCNDCVQKVSPFLDKIAGVQNWEVATKNAKKLLTVRGKSVDANEVIKMVKKGGFKATLVKESVLETA